MGEPCASSPSVTLCQKHSAGKVLLNEYGGSSCISHELVDEPLKVSLEHTFTLNPVCLKYSIQAGLRCSGLPTTVKQTNGVFFHLSNTIAVKEYKTHTIEKLNFSVAHLPILAIGNRLVHQAFDLTNGRVLKSTNIVWHEIRGNSRGLVPVLQLS